MKRSKGIAEELRAMGLSATKQRLILLGALRNAKEPIAAEELGQRLRAHMNLTTIYRGLRELVEVRLARRLAFGENRAFYEAALSHHHHVVCRSCGAIEDIDVCLSRALQEKVRRTAKKFASIDDHALEFFGTCRTCSA